jgi:hypothetical protein
MAEQLVSRPLFSQVPKQNDVVHACRGGILAGGVEVERHDGFFVALEGADEAGVFFVMHTIQIIYKNPT